MWTTNRDQGSDHILTYSYEIIIYKNWAFYDLFLYFWDESQYSIAFIKCLFILTKGLDILMHSERKLDHFNRQKRFSFLQIGFINVYLSTGLHRVRYRPVTFLNTSANSSYRYFPCRQVKFTQVNRCSTLIKLTTIHRCTLWFTYLDSN